MLIKQSPLVFEQCLGLLESDGRMHFVEPSKVSRGAAIGLAIAAHIDGDVMLDMVLEMLQEHNSHLTRAVVGVMERGDSIKTRRTGRIITIELPECWEK